MGKAKTKKRTFGAALILALALAAACCLSVGAAHPARVRAQLPSAAPSALFSEDFEALSQAEDSADFMLYESGATLRLTDEALSGEQSLFIEGQTDGWCNYLRAKSPLRQATAYTLEFKYRVHAEKGDFTVFVRNLETDDFPAAVHFTSGGAVEYTLIGKTLTEIRRMGAYNLVHITLPAVQGEHCYLGFGMEGKGKLTLDDIRLFEGAFGGEMQSAAAVYAYDFDTLGFYDSDFAIPASPQTQLFTNREAINGTYSIRSMPEMAYWTSILETRPDRVALKADTVYTVNFSYRLPVPTAPGEVFYIEALSGGKTVAYLRFNEFGVVEQYNAAGETGFGANNYLFDCGGYNRLKFSFRTSGDGTVLKLSKGTIMGGTPAPENGYIVADDLTITEGTVGDEGRGAHRTPAPEVVQESEYNTDFSGVQAFDASPASRWVPAPRADWQETGEVLTYIGLRYPSAVRLNYVVINEAVVAQDGYPLGAQITRAAVEILSGETWVTVGSFSGEGCLGENRKLLFPDISTAEIRLCVYAANGDPSINNLQFGYTPNLAVGCNTRVSSINGPATTGAHAVDDDPTTQWATAGAGDQFIEIDLGGTRAIDAVLLDEARFDGQENTPSTRAFRLWYYGAGDWHKITEGTEIGSLRVFSFDEVQAEKVKLQLTACAAGTYNFWSIGVYRTGGGAGLGGGRGAASITDVDTGRLTVEFPASQSERNVQYLLYLNGELYAQAAAEDLRFFGKEQALVAQNGNLACNAVVTASSDYGESYNGAKAADGNPDTRWGARGTAPHTLTLDFGHAAAFDTVVIDEAIINRVDGYYMGERVTGYRLEYWDGMRWRTAATGGKLGANAVVTFEPVIGSKLRLVITQALDEPTISEIAVYGNDLSANLSLGATGADNGNYGGEFAPASALDGNMATRWASNVADGAYLDISYDRPTRVDAVRLFECINWGANVGTFSLLQYNGTDFVPVTDGAGKPVSAEGIGLSRTLVFPAVETTALRILFGAAPTAPTLWGVETYNTAAPYNWAQGATAAASHTDYGLGAENLTDGKAGTRWATATVPTPDAPVTLTVTLPNVRTIGSFAIDEYLGEVASSWRVPHSIGKLRVEYNDNGTWRQCFLYEGDGALQAGTTVLNFDKAVRTDALRFIVLSVVGDAPSIWEIELYAFRTRLQSGSGTYASTGGAYGGMEADKAFDTNYETRWASQSFGGDSLTVTYTEPRTVDALTLCEAKGYFWGANVTSFTLSAQVDGAYKTVVTGGGIGFGRTLTFAPVTATRFRLDFVCATDKTVTLSEIRLWGRPTVSVRVPYAAYDLKLNMQNNIAPSAKATASSEWSGYYGADKVNDNDDSTRWSAAAGALTDQWVLLDFGQPRNFTTIKLSEEYAPRAGAFTVSAGNDKQNLVVVHSGTGIGANCKIELGKHSARYIRFDFPETSDVLTISEIGVYYCIDPFAETDITVETVAGGDSLHASVTLDEATLAEGAIEGTAFAGIGSDGTATYTFTVKGTDRYGRAFTGRNVDWSIQGGSMAGLAINADGVLSVSSDAAEGTVTLQAACDGLTLTKEVRLYEQVPAKIQIAGNTAVTVPAAGKQDASARYSARLIDQHGNGMAAPVALSVLGSAGIGAQVQPDGSLLVSVSAGVGANGFTVLAESGSVTESLDVTLSYFKYAPSGKDGFEIYNGSGVLNRPLYDSHVNDVSNGGFGYFGFAGDRPEAALAWTDGFNALAKRGHVFLGIEGGKWLSDMENIRAVYTPSMMEYVITDSSFVGEIRLTYVMGADFDGLITAVSLPDSLRGKLIAVTGGITAKEEKKMYDYDNLGSFGFKKQEAEGSAVTVLPSGFRISRKGYDIYATASVNSTTTTTDASVWGESVDTLLSTRGDRYTMAITRFDAAASDILFALTYESPDTIPALARFLTGGSGAVESVKNYYESVRGAFGVTTPDRYFDRTVTTAVMANDRLYDTPSFLHGIISWNFPYAGWRSMYGSTNIGWTDRVETSAAQFFDNQILDRTKQATPRDLVEGYMDKTRALAFGAVYDDVYGGNKFYDMTQSLVDMMFYNYEWTDNLEYFTADNDKAYNFIKYHLEWEEAVLGREDNLFENFLNMWNTDSIWSSGGGGTTQTAYNLRAYRMMAELAERLGKTKDAAYFAGRADAINKAMRRYLYSTEQGIFGQFKDLDEYGLGRTHFAPDMATLSVPMDLDLVDNFEAYQLIRYGMNAFADLPIDLPMGGKLKYSSDWEPKMMWSISDIYPDETIYFLNQLYKNGYGDDAYAYLKGFYQMFYGSDAPGAIWERQEHADGTGVGSTDFADTVSPYIKMITDGMFGIDMQANKGLVTIKPAFNRDWPTAKISGQAVGYEYAYDKASLTETITVSTQKSLAYTIMLAARTPNIKAVRVNGFDAAFTVTPQVDFAYVTVAVPASTGATVEVSYEAGEMPTLDYPAAVGNATQFTVSAQGAILTQVYDPQKLTDGTAENLGSAAVTLTTRSLTGAHTAFVKAETGDIAVWLPVNVDMRNNVSAADFTLTKTDGGAKAQFILQNNTDKAVGYSGTVLVAGAQLPFTASAEAFGETAKITLTLTAEQAACLTAGTNKLTVFLSDGRRVEAINTDWESAQSVAVKQLDLSGAANQTLGNLHKTAYSDLPTSKYISWTVLPNGRSYWEAHHNNGVTPAVDVSLYEQMKQQGGVTVNGVDFTLLQGEKDSVFTSRYRELPDAVTVPVNDRASKLYFLVVASTNQMQTNIANAVIRVTLKNGNTLSYELTNPKNLGDWMWNNISNQYIPYEKSGEPVMLGSNTHALMLDLDLGLTCDIASLTLETLSNEVLCGLLAVSYADNGATVRASGIAVESAARSVQKGEQFNVGAALVPAEAQDTLVYSSSDESVVTVNALGTATAHKAGEAVITITNSDKTLSATVHVTVQESAQTGIGLVSPPAKTQYVTGEALDLSGLVVNLLFADGSVQQIPVTPDMVSGYDPTRAGTQTVTVTYGMFTLTFDVIVTPPESTKLAAWQITLIVLGSVLGAAALAAGGFFGIRYLRTRKKAQ